ncbi:MAG: SPOR domain-containing protein [Pseudomonadota bacterium]
MLNLFFWSLLAANGLLFAYGQGLLEPLIPSGREPARMGKQLNASRLTVAPAAAPVAALPACTEIGNFTLAEAARFETQLASLPLDGKLSRREIGQAGGYMVFIPPQDGKSGADRKAAQLRQLKLTDFFVIQDNSDQRWGISLGIFKSEESAREHLATVERNGVVSARVVEYQSAPAKIAFQLRALDVATKNSVDKLKDDFSGLKTRNCE